MGDNGEDKHEKAKAARKKAELGDSIGYKKTADYLHNAGIRPSYQRVMVWNYLAGQRNHPTAEQIYAALVGELTGMSKTTVYNTLKLFVEKGLAVSLNMNENESRFDATTKFHAHFRCTRCGEIIDVDMPEDMAPFKGMEAYEVLERQLYLKGYCPRCKASLQ
ncbi:MAG: transcriptional repressor [Syntrophomonadaceae bacterium]|nr:transcriptional repressor [Syntrophomonadaceae bacterium]